MEPGLVGRRVRSRGRVGARAKVGLGLGLGLGFEVGLDRVRADLSCRTCGDAVSGTVLAGPELGRLGAWLGLK